jgi:hypothetical protein
MTEEFNREGVNSSAHASGVFEDFKAMPLDEKISSLFRMEIETLNEMIHAGADCAMNAFEKLGDTISTFGTKLENEARAAADANKTESASSAASETAYTSPTSDQEPPEYPADTGYTPPGRAEGSID